MCRMSSKNVRGRNLKYKAGCMEKSRLAIIVSHPIQHFVHLYRALAAVPSIELRVFFCSNRGVKKYFDRNMGVEIRWESDLLGGYESEFLPEANDISDVGFWFINNPSITEKLDSFRPDVVQIHGYAQMTLLRAWLWCFLHGVPVLLWSDSSLLFRRGAAKHAIKKIVLGLFLKRVGAVLSTGDNNANYYRYFGVPEDKIFRCPFTVDEEGLDRARMARADITKTMRAQLGIPHSAFVFLFVGKLMPLKRPRDILEALLLMREQRRLGVDTRVVFAGDGVLRGELESFASEHQLPTVFAGFVNLERLPKVYAMADALVFPSDREAYGLSAREAICVGLPLIVSDQIGCVGKTDAARPNENALVYPAGNVAALADAMAQVRDNPSLAASFSDASIRIAGEMHVEASVRGFLAAVSAVTGRGRPR